MADWTQRGRSAAGAVIFGFVLLMLTGCGRRNSGDGPSAAERAGCEAGCRIAFECTLGAPQEAVAACTDVCLSTLAESTEACRETSETLGECAAGKSCDELNSGTCAQEQNRSSRACQGLTGPDGGPLDSGDGATPPIENDCARFDFVVDGQPCIDCAYVTCDCDGSPQSLSACTPNGCIIETACAASCEASVSELLECTSTYRISGQDGGVCARRTCASAAAECGELDDSCGGTVSCSGLCQAPQTCGGGGLPNRCGCTPLRCSDVGAECGVIDNGCGQQLDCGSCSGVSYCGGGGAAHQCGCTPGEHTLGPQGAGTAASVAGPGGRVWSTPEAILSDDTATTSLRVGSDSSEWLVATHFRLDIPAAATVQGIEVRVRRRSRDGHVADNGARLVRSGTILAADRSLTPWWPPSFQEVIYGGPADLWGETWTPTQLNSQGFGFALATTRGNTAGNDDAFVAYVSVTVYHSVTCE